MLNPLRICIMQRDNKVTLNIRQSSPTYLKLQFDNWPDQGLVRKLGTLR